MVIFVPIPSGGGVRKARASRLTSVTGISESEPMTWNWSARRDESALIAAPALVTAFLLAALVVQKHQHGGDRRDHEDQDVAQ